MQKLVTNLLDYNAKLALRSSFNFHFFEREEHRFLSILDNGGGLSVDSNIKEICKFLFTEENKLIGYNAWNTEIMYKDTQGLWNGYNYNWSEFKVINAESQEDAVLYFLHPSKAQTWMDHTT